MPPYFLTWIALSLAWAAWLYPFLFRAPHNQKRPSITLAAPTRAGLLLETLAIFLALQFRIPDGSIPGALRIAGFLVLAAPSIFLSWSAVKHLGRQFRVNAGLYHDHELVRTGAYSIVRHPIYSGLFGMLGATLSLVTRWPWAIVAIVIFIAGTEIRVHTEDGLLASRFGPAFDAYRRNVRAYIPFVR
jgi:protein-S-isoprenylcysteine O-methyltransferase Ste14